MKKSEMYRMAQMAVVNSMTISPNVKIDIVRELMEREDLEAWKEKKAEEEENGTV